MARTALVVWARVRVSTRAALGLQAIRSQCVTLRMWPWLHHNRMTTPLRANTELQMDLQKMTQCEKS